MSMWAAPGVRCVCINDDFKTHFTMESGHSIPVRVPMLHEVLTIKRVEDWASGFGGEPGTAFLEFHEIPLRQVDGPLSGEITYSVKCFRPLVERKTDISIFTAMLTPQKARAAA